MKVWRRVIRLTVLSALLAGTLAGCRQTAAIDPGPPGKAGSCPALTPERAAKILVRLSSSPPGDVLPLATGEARQILEEENSFVAEGWPPAFLNGWMQEAWLSLRVTPLTDQTALILLTHGNPDWQTTTRFEVTCGDGWQLSRIGDSSSWYSPAPSQLPGQTGELTSDLALQIVADALEHYGTTRMRVSTTGPERERGQLLAVAVAAGATLQAQAWGGLGTNLRLERTSPTQAVGHWVDAMGSETGERVLFARVDGTWKLADHAEGGKWAPIRRPGFAEPRSISSDYGLLGVSMGMSRQTLGALLGTPDRVDGQSLLFSGRGLEVDVNDLGRVRRIATTSGATIRGLRVGDSAYTARRLYGTPAQSSDEGLTYREGPLSMHFLLRKDASGVLRVVQIDMATDA